MPEPRAETPAAAASSRWLFGPVPDLVLGCGLGYVVVFAALVAAGPLMLQWIPLGVLPLLILLTGTPHYGATLLRVYEERETRRRYAVFTVGVSAVLAVAFVASLQWYVLGSLLLTLYFNWNPWHYGGQNYGLAVMFLRRRDVAVDERAKRLLHASFVLSFVLAAIEMNGASRGSLYAPIVAETTAKSVGPVFRFIPLGIPADLQRWLTGVGLVAYLGCILASFASFKRSCRWRDLVPSALLVASQSLWFVVPSATRLWGLTGGVLPFSAKHNLYAFMWVAIGHSVQYLWVTSYYARREGRLGRPGGYFAKCVLAGAAIWHIPALLFAPGFFGGVAYSDGLRLLVASVVNLHHFLLDGAIWKLRDGRVANLLIRPAASDGGAAAGAEGIRWQRPLVWAAGVVGLFLAVTGIWEREFGVRQAGARGDVKRVRIAAERLHRIGQQEAAVHDALAEFALRRDGIDGALAELDKSLAIKPHPRTHFRKGKLYARRKDWRRAAQEYEAAYALDPYPLIVLRSLSNALIRSGQTRRAEEVLRDGLRQHPDDAELTQLMQRVQQSAAHSAPPAPG